MKESNFLGKKRQIKNEFKDNSDNESNESIYDININREKIAKGIVSYYYFRQQNKDKIYLLESYLVDKKWIEELIEKYISILNKINSPIGDYSYNIKLIKSYLDKESKISKIKFPEKSTINNNILIYMNHTFINEEALDYFLDGFNLDKNDKNNKIKVSVSLNKNVYCIEYDNLFDFQFKNTYGKYDKRYIIQFFSDKYLQSSFVNKTLSEGISYIEAYSKQEEIHCTKIKKKKKKKRKRKNI